MLLYCWWWWYDYYSMLSTPKRLYKRCSSEPFFIGIKSINQDIIHLAFFIPLSTRFILFPTTTYEKNERGLLAHFFRGDDCNAKETKSKREFLVWLKILLIQVSLTAKTKQNSRSETKREQMMKKKIYMMECFQRLFSISFHSIWIMVIWCWRADLLKHEPLIRKLFCWCSCLST